MRGLLALIKKYYFVLLFIILEVIALVMLSKHNAYQHSALVNFTREINGAIYAKVEGAREYLHLRKNNEILVRENTALRNKNTQLKNALKPDSLIIRNQNFFYQPAKIVHSTYYKQYNYITINKGRKQGVGSDMAVISENGIVGIVLESSANYSTVIPIINREFRLSAKVSKNDYVGILQWEGDSPETAILNEIPHHANVANGDSIVTSGFSAIFPEGLYVGNISDYSKLEGNFYRIEVDLGTNFQSLFHVNVITNMMRDEQIELERNTIR